MIKNYLLISFRSLLRNKFSFVLNVLGLSVGMACVVLCYLHIQYELSYDTWPEDSDRIYRIVTGDVPGGEGWVKVSAPMPGKIVSDVPQVTDYARLTKGTYESKITVKHQDNIFNEGGFYIADRSFLNFFDVRIIRGDDDNALSDINSIIISNSTSTKYFGTDDPVGKTLNIDNQYNFTISGVFEDIRPNSHFQFDFLASFDNLERLLPNTSLTSNWGQFNYFAYVLLHDKATKEQAESNIHNMNINLGPNKNMELYDIHLQSLKSIHFVPNSGNILPAYESQYLYIYSAIASAILIISFINFVNLSTAGSTKRIKEVGVRKVVGASRPQLIFQFISETIIVTGASLVTGLILLESLMLPYINELLNTHISINYADISLYAAFLLLIVVISMFSGAYIAFFITSFTPVNALKGALKIGTSGARFKKILIGIQFAISVVLVLGSFFIYQQLNYLNEQDLGLNPSQILNISLYDQTAREKAKLLKETLESTSSVENVSASRFVAGQSNWNNRVWWEGQEEATSMALIITDEHFLSTMEINLIEGDNNTLTQPLGPKEYRYILNKAALDLMGWNQAVGKGFSAFGTGVKRPVSGVVENFNFRSLHHSIQPCVIVMNGAMQPSQLMLRLDTQDLSNTLNEVENKFSSITPNSPFEYAFLDEQFHKLYESESRTVRVITFLTVIAVLLCALGLYGLVSFMVQERTREMAIRKVLGVTMSNILLLLSESYLKIFLLANVFGIPVLWYSMDQWLSNFSYRIDMTLVVFIAAPLFVLAIILLTVGSKAVTVARSNPIDGLRYE